MYLINFKELLRNLKKKKLIYLCHIMFVLLLVTNISNPYYKSKKKRTYK